MDLVKEFRENTRHLECHLGNMNQSDCCCSGINATQCFLIVEIGRKPGISGKELSQILRIDKSGISRAVEELVLKGLVERKTSKEDRRFLTLNLTTEGEARFEMIENDMYLKFKEVLRQIPENKQELVIEALKIYNEACEKMEEKQND